MPTLLFAAPPVASAAISASVRTIGRTPVCNLFCNNACGAASARTMVFTDASVRAGDGGIAFAAQRPNGRWYIFSARVPGVKDINRLELIAILAALTAFEGESGDIGVVTDSEVALEHLGRSTRAETHRSKRFRSSKYHGICNIIHACTSRRKGATSFFKVKAHSNVLGNELADALAWLAAANRNASYISESTDRSV